MEELGDVVDSNGDGGDDCFVSSSLHDTNPKMNFSVRVFTLLIFSHAEQFWIDRLSCLL